MPEAEWKIVRKQIIESITMLDLYRIEEGNSNYAGSQKNASEIFYCYLKLSRLLKQEGLRKSGKSYCPFWKKIWVQKSR